MRQHGPANTVPCAANPCTSVSTVSAHLDTAFAVSTGPQACSGMVCIVVAWPKIRTCIVDNPVEFGTCRYRALLKPGCSAGRCIAMILLCTARVSDLFKPCM